jgi:peptidyl-tRNA hydrolase, PTH2 family
VDEDRGAAPVACIRSTVLEPGQALIRCVITLRKKDGQGKRDGRCGGTGDIKQVIVVRADLKMGKGKIAAQVAHAALEAADTSRRRYPDWYESWRDQGQAKVVVKTDGGEPALHELQKQARTAGLPAALIQDRGLTQLEPGTTTCLAIGPAPADAIDRLTGALKLL